MSDAVNAIVDAFEKFNSMLSSYLTECCSVLPVGTIVPWMGTNFAASGFVLNGKKLFMLPCDGTVYNIDLYPELANLFDSEFGIKNYFGGDGTATFAVPDLRGEFLRGTGTNSHANQGSGEDVGSYQAATQLREFWANNQYKGYSFLEASSTSYPSITTAANPDVVDSTIQRKSIMVFGSGRSRNTTASVIAYNLRPTNTSVNYCIVPKTTYLYDKDSSYSLSEEKVGYWVDGKPLYQRTFAVDDPVLDSNKIYAFSPISDMDHGFIDGGYVEGATMMQMLCKCDPGRTSAYSFFASVRPDGTVCVKFGSNYSSSDIKKIVVTVRYTKTID